MCSRGQGVLPRELLKSTEEKIEHENEVFSVCTSRQGVRAGSLGEYKSKWGPNTNEETLQA